MQSLWKEISMENTQRKYTYGIINLTQCFSTIIFGWIRFESVIYRWYIRIVALSLIKFTDGGEKEKKKRKKKKILKFVFEDLVSKVCESTVGRV